MSEPPGDLAVNSSFDLGALSGDERRTKFSMLLMQQILADDCQLQILDGPPSKADIQAHISSYVSLDVRLGGRPLENEELAVGYTNGVAAHRFRAEARGLAFIGRSVSAWDGPANLTGTGHV